VARLRLLVSPPKDGPVLTRSESRSMLVSIGGPQWADEVSRAL
jgi:hypothetical protein